MSPMHAMSNELLVPNRREVVHRPSASYQRPRSARTSSFDQPATPIPGDLSLRDPSWRNADRRDLYALAALAFSLSTLATAAAFAANAG